jgi:hypothetical protein
VRSNTRVIDFVVLEPCSTHVPIHILTRPALAGAEQAITEAAMSQEFEGKIELDIRDSTPDWSSYLAKQAPEGSPNVLIILYDDTGLAAWSPYGGRIQMPTMDRLAENGLTYRSGTPPRCAARPVRAF